MGVVFLVVEFDSSSSDDNTSALTNKTHKLLSTTLLEASVFILRSLFLLFIKITSAVTANLSNLLDNVSSVMCNSSIPTVSGLCSLRRPHVLNGMSPILFMSSGDF